MDKKCDAVLVSVVIPVYNVENYLAECLESVCNQTYQNLEIIVVDDGSTDGSGRICDEYSIKDSRIQVIHKRNGGLSDARNAGLERATGKYISFIDSDDAVDEEFIEALLEECQHSGAEIAVCRYEKFDNEFKHITSMRKDDFTYSGSELLKKMFDGTESGIEFVAWNKLYERKLMIENDIKYPVGKYNEDLFVTYKLLYLANKIGIVDGQLYKYRVRPGSIMNSGFSLKRLDGLEGQREMAEFFFQKREYDLVGDTLYSYCRIAMYLYNLTFSATDRQLAVKGRKLIYHEYKEMWSRWKKYYRKSLPKKIAISLFLIVPSQAAKIFN